MEGAIDFGHRAFRRYSLVSRRARFTPSLSLLALFVGAVVLAACASSSAELADSTPDPTPDRMTTTTTTTGSADSELAASRAKFAAASSYHLVLNATTADTSSSVTADAAYASSSAVYARTEFTGEIAKRDDFTAYLFLPPDLYLLRPDGSWFVQSPWNQGYRPGVLASIGIEKPIVSYADVIDALKKPKRIDDDTLAGSLAHRYRGGLDLSGLPFFGNGTANLPSATATIWIDATTALPVRVEIEAGGRDGFRLTLDLSAYGESAKAPDKPVDVRPLRDLQFPDAACTGPALPACLEAQTALTNTSPSCLPANVRRVCLVPLGKISVKLVDDLVAYYQQQFGLTVTVLTPQPIAAKLEDPLRQQIDAGFLMDYMGERFPDANSDPSAVLIGVTPVDLYESGSHIRYLFGLKGTPDNPKAVLSSLRMDPQFYSEDADQDLYISRTRKLLSKYIGYLYFQLPLSSDPASPMYDSIGGPDDVDRMTEPLPVHTH